MISTDPNTCGSCRYFGSCTTTHKSITATRKRCKNYEALPSQAKVFEILNEISKLSFCDQNQIRFLLNSSIVDLAKAGLKSGMIVGFSAGETKGWVEGKIMGFEDQYVVLQDADGVTWKTFPGFINVMLKSEE